MASKGYFHSTPNDYHRLTWALRSLLKTYQECVVFCVEISGSLVAPIGVGKAMQCSNFVVLLTDGKSASVDSFLCARLW